MKRTLSLLLILAMLLSALCACDGTADPDAAASSTASDAERISWRTAFRDKSLPEGEVSTEDIAFYQIAGDGTISIHNVSQQEVADEMAATDMLPRTHYFEQYLPEKLLPLLPILDYAVAHNYCRMSIPTAEFHDTDITANVRYLNYMYRFNASGVTALDVKSVACADGVTRSFVLVTLGGMDARGMMPKYIEAIIEAKRIVNEMPKFDTQMDQALYLYQYLTEHVRYADDDYYSDGGWNLLYDTLIKKRTVCAGYTETLYFLYNLSGIECFTLSGYLTGTGGNGYHIWNVANVDGTYYQFDATWDEGVLPADYRFFAVSDEDMQSFRTRHIDTAAEEYCPDCTESFLPAITPEIADSVKGQGLWFYLKLCDGWYDDPAKVLSRQMPDYFPEMKRLSETDEGILFDLSYNDFIVQLSYFMTPVAAMQFCKGRYVQRDGKVFALRPDETAYRGHRLLSFTEEEDGSVTATVALLDDSLRQVGTVEVIMTYAETEEATYIAGFALTGSAAKHG